MTNKLGIFYTLLLLFSLGMASYVLSTVVNTNRVITIIAIYSLVIGVAVLAKLNLESVGLAKESLGKGVMYALPFMTIIILGALAVFFINPEIFKDERYNQGSQAMFYTILVTLPLATVIIEELAFRGVLFGTLQSVVTQNYAIIVSSLGFGIWHVFGASGVNAGSISSTIVIPKLVLVIGVILATSIAGVFFTWLRIKSGSLITPILVHWTINATGVVLAFLAWQKP